MDFGLASFGSALGEPSPVDAVVHEYTQDVERVRGYGYRTVHRSRPGIGVSDLAYEAARHALDAAGLDASEVDLIVFALTDLAEYLYWDPAASLQHRLGAVNAEALLITQACTAGIVGLDLIAGKFATRPDYRTAVLVAGNRSCEAYWNRMETQSMVFSDGAAAAVAQRGHERIRWRASELLTDGRYAAFHLMDAGGTAAPFSAETLGRGAPQARDAWDIMEFFDYDDRLFADFVDQLTRRGRLIVERACARSGLQIGDLRKLIFLHDNLRSVESLAAEFGLPVTATNLEFGLDTGHVGAADQIYSLARMVEQGEVQPGDLVALLGLGRGMHWACALVEI